jgi:hypothetical protein
VVIKEVKVVETLEEDVETEKSSLTILAGISKRKEKKADREINPLVLEDERNANLMFVTNS